jgi:hypothetical protein
MTARRRATAAERQQAREVARFVYARNLADQPLLVSARREISISAPSGRRLSNIGRHEYHHRLFAIP